MANNYITSNNSTLENYPLDNASVGRVLTDSTVTLDRSMLLSNNDQSLPTDNKFASPSASDIGDLPPNYFDTSIVPNGAILYNNEVTPYTEASKAEIGRNSTGVPSFDPLIANNVDQLWLYFMTCLNEKPQLKYFKASETYTDSNGNMQTCFVDGTHDVTEFKYTVDLSPYICEHWWRVAVIPSAEAVRVGEIVILRDALEQYILSKKKIKEIIMKKQLYGWNLVELQDQLMRLVRSIAYQNQISISYDSLNYEIAARSSSKLSRFANSIVVRVLCCISCLCIIFGPIYCCLSATGSTRDKIAADCVMMKSTDTFLQLNSLMIVNTVIGRSFTFYIAHYA